MSDSRTEYMRKLVLKRQFELRATQTSSWKFRSQVLKRAADHLFEIYHDSVSQDIADAFHMMSTGINRMVSDDEAMQSMLDGSLIGVYFLLMGHAIENVVKGICIARHPEYFEQDKL